MQKPFIRCISQGTCVLHGVHGILFSFLLSKFKDKYYDVSMVRLGLGLEIMLDNKESRSNAPLVRLELGLEIMLDNKESLSNAPLN